MTRILRIFADLVSDPRKAAVSASSAFYSRPRIRYCTPPDVERFFRDVLVECFRPIHRFMFHAPIKSWGRDFGDGLIRHPTQAYESLFHLGMAFVLGLLLGEGRLRGHHLQIYLIAYGVYRFLTEYIRPEPIWAGGPTFYQWVSLTPIAAMAGQWWTERGQEWTDNAFPSSLPQQPVFPSPPLDK